MKNLDSTIVAAKLNDYIKLDEYRMRNKTIVQPVTFSHKSAVFINPDTTSQLVQYLEFNTAIEPITDEYIDGWIKIQLENKIGYIQTSDVALYSFFTHFKAPKSKYFIKDGSIYKFHLRQNIFTDTFDLKGIDVEYAQQINAKEWGQVDLLISLNSYGQCCGCSDKQFYIIDANGKFEILFETFQMFLDDGVDEGYDSGYETNVFFPVNPQKDTITFIEREFGPILNDKKEFKRNKAGEIITGTLKRLKKYYMWDGKGLIEIKP